MKDIDPDVVATMQQKHILCDSRFVILMNKVTVTLVVWMQELIGNLAIQSPTDTFKSIPKK